MLSFLANLNPDFKKLLSGSGLVMAFKVVGAGAGYVFAYLITSNYGARAFGIFELSLTALTIASSMATRIAIAATANITCLSPFHHDQSLPTDRHVHSSGRFLSHLRLLVSKHERQSYLLRQQSIQYLV